MHKAIDISEKTIIPVNGVIYSLYHGTASNQLYQSLFSKATLKYPFDTLGDNMVIGALIIIFQSIHTMQ